MCLIRRVSHPCLQFNLMLLSSSHNLGTTERREIALFTVWCSNETTTTYSLRGQQIHSFIHTLPVWWSESVNNYYKFLVVSADETMIKCKTLGGIMQVSHSTAATHLCIYITLALCVYTVHAPSRPSPVSRLFHAGCTSS